MTSTMAREANQRRAVELLSRSWRLPVGGDLVALDRLFPVTSPYSGEVIAEVPNATAADARAVVDSAVAGSRRWAAVPAAERGEYVMRLADELERRAADFAIVDAVDGGAPVAVMGLDVSMAVESLRYYAGLAREIKGFTVPSSTNLHFTEQHPWGVVARIIPFNHPILFAASKIAAPLVAGNAVVLKPAEATPLSALLFGELANQILPPGVLSVVVGDGPEVPDALVRDKRIRRIGFTGSEQTGLAILKAAAETSVKSVSLELGGKNALIAFPDADPDEVAQGAVRGMNFTWSGQSCGSTSRVLLHDSIADAVLGRVRQLVSDRDYPTPLDPSAIQGTMVNQRQYDRVLDYIARANDSGFELVTGGGRPASAMQGLFIEPTFYDGVDPDSSVATEEIFGPVVSVIRWTDRNLAVEIANRLHYGLTGSIYTNDIREAHRTARELDTGFVWINGAGPHYQGLPYGGWKNSGLGRDEGLDELISYTQTKSTTVCL